MLFQLVELVGIQDFAEHQTGFDILDNHLALGIRDFCGQLAHRCIVNGICGKGPVHFET
jgi:hypothetical protein